MAKKREQETDNLAQLSQRVADLESEVLRLTDENERLRAGGAVVNSATVQTLGKQNQPAEFPEFEYDGKGYRFRVAAFRISGQKRLAVQVIDDPVLLAEVVDKYPGLITEL